MKQKQHQLYIEYEYYLSNMKYEIDKIMIYKMFIAHQSQN